MDKVQQQKTSLKKNLSYPFRVVQFAVCHFRVLKGFFSTLKFLRATAKHSQPQEGRTVVRRKDGRLLITLFCLVGLAILLIGSAQVEECRALLFRQRLRSNLLIDCRGLREIARNRTGDRLQKEVG